MEDREKAIKMVVRKLTRKQMVKYGIPPWQAHKINYEASHMKFGKPIRPTTKKIFGFTGIGSSKIPVFRTNPKWGLRRGISLLKGPHSELKRARKEGEIW